MVPNETYNLLFREHANSTKTSATAKKDKRFVSFGTTGIYAVIRFKPPIKKGLRSTCQSDPQFSMISGKSVLEGDSDDDGDANTYDYDDSFIEDDEGDDESYEDSEDEDFVPSDDGDDGGEEKEDISDLVSEAKDFIDG